MAGYNKEHIYSVESFINQNVQNEDLFTVLLSTTDPEPDYNGIHIWDVYAVDDEADPEILKMLLHTRVQKLSEQIEKAAGILTGYSPKRPAYNDWLLLMGVYDEFGEEVYAEYIVLCD